MTDESAAGHGLKNAKTSKPSKRQKKKVDSTNLAMLEKSHIKRCPSLVGLRVH